MTTEEVKQPTGLSMSTKYNPSEIEGKWYRHWEQSGFFTADPTSEKPKFSIVIPPPNVTGSLHIGHALNNTLQDILSRKKRMEGYDVLWVPGCDHAGIATQNVVERYLKNEGVSRHDLGRDEFVKRVWTWKEEYGGTIMRQLRRLGSSCDWTRERFTMDAGLSEAVKEVFVRLYQEQLIYRGDYIINWCPRCHTALSDIESDHQEVEGHFWHIRYPLTDGSGEIIVATTRPETMLGDTAVAVHPEDSRYQALVGQTVLLPLLNRQIPIIADEYVDQTFGSGAVKITPAHDPNDFLVGERHQLERINVMNPDGTMSAAAGPYQGLDRFACRKKIIADLTSQNYLVKTEDHTHAVGHCYRCHTVVEPYLSRQWFVKMKDLAQPAITAVKEGKIKFTPIHWERNYLEWLANIRDWCISRQIWWGHRIPAWYCDACDELHVAKQGPIKCTKCGHEKLRQDTDVLDTWFSSGLWPFSTMGWPQQTIELDKYYPTSVLVTSWDIIFFWVARMVMMGLKFMGQVPFHEVCINSLVGDEEGKKMSKSKGNTVDPLDLLEHTSADGLRFTMAMIETQSRYVAFTPDRLESCRNFVNKIWNAARFALMNLQDYQVPVELPEKSFAEQWIQSRLVNVVERVDRTIDGYRFAEAAQALIDFVWHEFCDWYLEMVKSRLFKEQAAKAGAQYWLLQTLNEMLRLLHPFMPFVTEEIWSYLPNTKQSIMLAAWPSADPERRDLAIEQQMNAIMDIIYAVRNIRGDMNVAPGKKVPLIIRPLEQSFELSEEQCRIIRELAKCESVVVGQQQDKPDLSAAAVTSQVECLVPLAGLIDIEKEKRRLTKEIDQFNHLLQKIKNKLGNRQFMDRAPGHVIESEKKKQQDYEQKIKQLNANLLQYQ